MVCIPGPHPTSSMFGFLGRSLSNVQAFLLIPCRPGLLLGGCGVISQKMSGSFSVMTTTWGDRRLRVAHKNFDVCENEMGGFGLFGLLVVFFVGFYGYGFFADDHVWFGFFLLNVDD